MCMSADRTHVQRYRSDKIVPGVGSMLTFKQLGAEDFPNIHHFRKIWACYAMSVDAGWRSDAAYGAAFTDQYLDEEAGAQDSARRNRAASVYQRRAAKGDIVFFVCYDRERLVGVCSLTDWTQYQEEYHNLGTQVSRLYVLPGYEKRGVGDALLTMAEYCAKEKGLDRLYLEGTKPSETFYLRRGYVDAPADKFPVPWHSATD